MTVLKDDMDPRKTSREILTRNYCRSCQAAVCNDLAGDDGKLQRRVRQGYVMRMSARPPPS